MSETSALDALNRTIRVSDQSCTAYALLRDRYRRRSAVLDIAILLLSAWVSAMVWVQPQIAEELTPRLVSRDMWIGLLSLTAFMLSLVQLQVNWKGRAASFHQAMSVLSTYVKELRPLRAGADETVITTALARYQAITEPLEPIPESDFLRLKQKHRIKLTMSRYLDSHPGANLSILRLAICVRHTSHSIKDEATR